MKNQNVVLGPGGKPGGLPTLLGSNNYGYMMKGSPGFSSMDPAALASLMTGDGFNPMNDALRARAASAQGFKYGPAPGPGGPGGPGGPPSTGGLEPGLPPRTGGPEPMRRRSPLSSLFLPVG